MQSSSKPQERIDSRMFLSVFRSSAKFCRGSILIFCVLLAAGCADLGGDVTKTISVMTGIPTFEEVGGAPLSMWKQEGFVASDGSYLDNMRLRGEGRNYELYDAFLENVQFITDSGISFEDAVRLKISGHSFVLLKDYRGLSPAYVFACFQKFGTDECVKFGEVDIPRSSWGGAHEWLSHGWSIDELEEWLDVRESNDDKWGKTKSVIEWRKLVKTVEMYGKLSNEDVSPGLINEWIEQGFSFDETTKWIFAGFRSADWLRDGLDAGLNKTELLMVDGSKLPPKLLKELLPTIKAKCKAKVSNQSVSVQSPYSIKRKCFFVSDFSIIQVLDRKNSLVRDNDAIASSDFLRRLGMQEGGSKIFSLTSLPAKSSRKGFRSSALVIGAAPFSYTTVSGAKEVVPSAEVLKLY